jgi:heme exporter protein D
MGGYAWFVWPAYAFSAVIMIGLVVTSLTALRRDKKILAALEAANSRRPMRRQGSPTETSPPEPALTPAPEEASSDA